MKIFLLIFSILLVVMVTIYRYPEKMLSPGKLLKGHETISKDCFTCHAVTKGTPDEKCLSCHKLVDIGIVTTEGVRIDTSKKTSAFHQYLTDKTCVTCHSDHKGTVDEGQLKSFEHDALKGFSENCKGCHNSPPDTIHRWVSGNCNLCHNMTKWKPAKFTHKAVSKSIECALCHTRPDDMLHGNVPEKCGDCHITDKWSPASFEHDEYFRLDKDHITDCKTCHPANSFSEYTCYGCHEHSFSKMKKEHQKEGIRDFNKCVECHRSADEHEAEKKWKSMRSGKGRGGDHGKKDKRKKHNKRHKDDDDHHDDHDDDEDKDDHDDDD